MSGLRDVAATLAYASSNLEARRRDLGAHPDSRALRNLVDQALGAYASARQALIDAVRPEVETAIRDEIAAEEPRWVTVVVASRELNIPQSTLRAWAHQSDAALRSMFAQPAGGRILINVNGFAKRLGGVGVRAA